MSETNTTIFNNEYEILKKIGDGLTSIVYLAKKENTLVAIKIIKKSYALDNLALVQ